MKVKNLLRKINLIIATILCTCQLNSQQLYVNQEWEVSNGFSGLYEYTSSAIDNNGNHIFIGNKKINQTSSISFNSLQANGNINWSQTNVNTTTHDDYGSDLVIDALNNVFVCGAKHNGLNYDYYIAKYSSTGILIWQQIYNGSGNGDDIPSSLAIDNLGNVYITGASTGSNLLPDFATIKLNNTGSVLWTKTYDFNNKYDVATDIVINNIGEIIVCGGSTDNLMNSDFVVIKYNQLNGNQLNLKRHNTPGNGFDIPVEMLSDNVGNIYVTGISDANGNKNIKTIAFSPSLQQINWVKYTDKSGNEDEASGIALDNNGKIIITGFTQKTNLGKDILIEKRDQINGNLIWEKQKQATYELDVAKGKKVKVDQNNNIYVTGETVENGITKIITSAYDYNGEIIFEKTFAKENSFSNKPTQIQVRNNEIYITGIAESTSGKELITIKYSTIKKPEVPVYIDSKPSHVSNELIIKFDRSSIIESIIYKKGYEYGKLDQFVKADVLMQMEQKTKIDWRALPTYKIFRKMTPADSISINRLGDTILMDEFWTILSVYLPLNTNDQVAINNLNTLKEIIHYSERNYIGQLNSSTNDPIFPLSQTGLMNISSGINVEGAWDKQVGRTNVKVGIFDSGINWDHEDFGDGTQNGTKVIGGWDFQSNTNIFNSTNHDPNGHGSACAGIVGALRNNNKGGAGIVGGDVLDGNSGCQLFSLKINDGSNFVTSTKISEAIIEGSTYNPGTGFGYGLHVQNHSWGGPNYSETIKQSVKSCYVNNCVFVASSGNYPSSCNTIDCVLYPSSYNDDWVLKVGASDIGGGVANFSVQGNNIDVIAPGVNELYSTVDNFNNTGYTYDGDGTSFSAPHATGVSALLCSEHNVNNGYPNNLSPEDVEVFLQSFSTDIGAVGYDQETGYGRINANNALNKLSLPQYFVRHSGGQNSPLVTTAANLQVVVANNINGVAAGNYIADRYQVTSTFIDILSPNRTVLSHWPRYSSSVGVSAANPINGDTWFTYSPTIVQNVASVATTTFCWYVKFTTGGQAINKWIPAAPSELKTAYSLYVHDNTILGINQNEIDTKFNIYPNPSSGLITIDYVSNDESDTKLELIDITGRVIANYNLENQTNGNQSLNVNINSLSNGIYVLNLTIGSEIISKRIIKN